MSAVSDEMRRRVENFCHDVLLLQWHLNEQRTHPSSYKQLMKKKFGSKLHNLFKESHELEGLIGAIPNDTYFDRRGSLEMWCERLVKLEFEYREYRGDALEKSRRVGIILVS